MEVSPGEEGHFLVNRGHNCQGLHPLPLRWACENDTSAYGEKECEARRTFRGA
jgi:hypothetical protein